MIVIPMSPANLISIHNRYEIINATNGPVHIEFIVRPTNSNRLTSFDNKFTTLPGDVPLRAVCDSRNVYDTNTDKLSI